jgi:hypothetical protein
MSAESDCADCVAQGALLRSISDGSESSSAEGPRCLGRLLSATGSLPSDAEGVVDARSSSESEEDSELDSSGLRKNRDMTQSWRVHQSLRIGVRD